MNRRNFFARFAALAAGFVAAPKLSGLKSPPIPAYGKEKTVMAVYRLDENRWRFTKEQLGLTT